MYRQYRYLPEVNRPCCRATRSREYQAHIDALHRIQTHKGAIDTSHPNTPQTIGRNYKRYEHEKQRNLQIRKDNMRLIGKMDKISREEHYPRAPPQRPYTLQGSRQRDEMQRITHENRKLLNAVQDRKPTLNRNDWLMHRLDHQYQLNKMSEYKQTVPMSEIMRQELGMNQGYTGSSYAGSSTRRSSNASTARKSYSHASKGALEDEVEDRPNSAQEEEQGVLEDQFSQNAGGLLGTNGQEENKSQSGRSQKSQSGNSQVHEPDDGEDVADEGEDVPDEGDRQSAASQNSHKTNGGKLEAHIENTANGLLGGGGGDNGSEKGELEQHVDDTTNKLLG